MVAERRVTDGEIAQAGLAYSEDGTRIVVGERSGVVVELDADTLEALSPPVDIVASLGWITSAGNERTAVALPASGSSPDQLVGWTYALVDFVDGESIKVDLALRPSYADASPDGERLAVGATDGEIGVVELATGQWVRPPADSHTDLVYRIAFNRDGSTFVTSAWDGGVVLWDASTATPLATFAPSDSESTTTVEFLDDGHTVMLARTDGAVHTWDTSVENWIQYACGVAGRNLTDNEWRHAFGDRPYGETCPTA
jgi:WD40 repeat protein